MGRLILAFWLLVGSFGLFHGTHPTAAASRPGHGYALDGGIFPPIRD